MDCELSGDEIVVLNRYDFTNLSEYKFNYQIKVDGEITEENIFALDIEPKQTAKIKITLPKECKLGAYVHCYLYNKAGYCVYNTLCYQYSRVAVGIKNSSVYCHRTDAGHYRTAYKALCEASAVSTVGVGALRA